MLRKLVQFVKDEEGVTMVEYALVLALVAILAIAAWRLLGTNLSSKVDEAANAVK